MTAILKIAVLSLPLLTGLALGRGHGPDPAPKKAEALPQAKPVKNAASVADLWEGNAQLAFQHELKIEPANPAAAGSGWMVVDKGVWYWFYRDIPTKPMPGNCGNDYVRTVVKKSVDQGKTWSEKVTVAEPDGNPKGSGCAILDGSTFLDPKTGIWHLLAQCLATKDAPGGVAWNLCHYTRDGGPFGPFTADPANPVVKSGQVFNKLCQIPGSQCPPGISDEGTPNIIAKEGDDFLVTFHGVRVEKEAVLGYRGMAKTKDFKEWTVGSKDGSLPNGLMFAPRDFKDAVKGTIGVGASSEIFGNDGYLYSVVEAPTLSLMCTKGQDWPVLLVRADRKAMGSGSWSPPPKQPAPLLKAEGVGEPCAIQYARWVEDPKHGLFLVYWDSKKGHQLMKVARKSE